MKVNNTFIFIELSYINEELFIFLKNYISLNFNFDFIKDKKALPLNFKLEGNVAILVGYCESEKDLLPIHNNLSNFIDKFNPFLTILTVHYNNYWYSIDELSKLLSKLNQFDVLFKLLILNTNIVKILESTNHSLISVINYKT